MLLLFSVCFCFVVVNLVSVVVGGVVDVVVVDVVDVVVDVHGLW